VIDDCIQFIFTTALVCGTKQHIGKYFKDKVKFSVCYASHSIVVAFMAMKSNMQCLTGLMQSRFANLQKQLSNTVKEADMPLPLALMVFSMEFNSLAELVGEAKEQLQQQPGSDIIHSVQSSSVASPAATEQPTSEDPIVNAC
jgi:hypothetical protein